MKETIYTIPINEAFSAKCGCPLCTLEEKLENNALDYIMGAAMMEPDVREETNKLGFCAKHYEDMLAMKNRLSLALLLESRLKQIQTYMDEQYRNGSFNPKKTMDSLTETARSCFVCQRIANFMEQYYKNILYMWKGDSVFRAQFAQQDWFCIKHMSYLLEYGKKELAKKDFALFSDMLLQIEKTYLVRLNGDIEKFCQSFDYRFAGQEIGDAKFAVERAVQFLSASKKALDSI